ncbi:MULTISPECIES: ArsR/SmtB family transcription factor [Sporosarcina]|uniref:ArsR family transcriptional regulator n=1 Tax=Sporosarcina newyorkensis TaxID=759851 RepID=A0A1T4YIC8_9BACL|nr:MULTISPECIES: metalloregulator ArsR/SmtB family transcription factor [Sporosarcina]MBY0222763.1 winged helix-turn-helix transcriptional regulator [Sporosarcina aquimarina]SKB01288.1 ArsR family transcriptional regulator [Sporosarcina newyorkensis]
MDIETLERYMKTLGDKSRLRLLKALEEGPLCICDLTVLLDVSQPAVSQHMHRLKKEGIVLDERRGRWIYWSINAHHPQYSLLLDLLKLLPRQTTTCREENNRCK